MGKYSKPEGSYSDTAYTYTAPVAVGEPAPTEVASQQDETTPSPILSKAGENQTSPVLDSYLTVVRYYPTDPVVRQEAS